MKLYIPTMRASDETHALERFLTHTAFRKLDDARLIFNELAETYDNMEGYIRKETTDMTILYAVKATPDDYTIELRIETFLVV